MYSLSEILQRTTDTKALVIGKDAMSQVGEMFVNLFPGKKAIVIADTNTYAVAGQYVESKLKAAGLIGADSFIYDDPDLFAEWNYVLQAEAQIKQKEDLIAVAVGSGVINDLVKLASSHLSRPYMIVGTAASMDGYTAYGASITCDGNKQTLDCPAPKGAIIDPEVSAKAPKEMVASGYADLIAKIPAGADWMIADMLGIEKIDEFSWNLVQDKLRSSLSQPAACKAGDVKYTEALAEGLIMSGFAMQAIQSSRPASGTEHQYSHFWDMEGLCFNGKHVSHGFKVGIGTLVSTASLEFLLDYDLSKIDIEKAVAAWPLWPDMEKLILTLFDGMPGHIARALKETKNKYLTPDQLREELKLFVSEFPKHKEEIRKQIYSFEEVRNSLKEVGAPYEPEQIGVSRERLRWTYRRIPYMRSRYTNADIIYRLGLLDELENKLFGKGGVWEIK